MGEEAFQRILTTKQKTRNDLLGTDTNLTTPIAGKVLRVQDRDDGNHIYLEHNIHCLFPTWHWGEDTLKLGDEIYVDGFLERCIEGDVQLNPAIKRGSKAPFTPKE
jgi:hypothetical protein